MVTEYRHGIFTLEDDNDIRPIATGPSNIIAVWGTAPDADGDEFPLHTPVLIAGNPRHALKLGTRGTLPDAIDGIFDQFGAAVVVIRVEDSNDIDTMMSNLIGSHVALTGIHAVKKARTTLKCVPKILIAPGFTAYRPPDGVAAINVTNGGHDYTANTIARVEGDGHGVSLTVVRNNGAIAAIIPTKKGWGFTVPPTVVIEDPGEPASAEFVLSAVPAENSEVTIGSRTYKFVSALASADDVLIGATASATVSNLVDAILAATAKAGVTYGNGTAAHSAVTAAKSGNVTMKVTAKTGGASGNSIAVSTTAATGSWGDGVTTLSGGVAGDGATATAVLGRVANPVVAEMIGVAEDMRAIIIADSQNLSYADAIAYRNDFDTDRLWIVEGGSQVWSTEINAAVSKPIAPRLAGKQAYMDERRGFWWSASNQPLNGIIGVDRIIDWSFTSSTVEGQLLNSHGIAVAVHADGFRVLGTRSPTSKSAWVFIPVRRTADMVYDLIEKVLQEAIDRPINLGLLDWIEGTITANLRVLVNAGALLGGKAWFDKTLNPQEVMQGGGLHVSMDFEPPAPLEKLTIHAHRNAGYYTEVIDTFLRNAQ